MEGVTRTREYIPGIDGLRAFAVLAVVLFHLQVGSFRGGFLGVSLFFTLSGYLITSLLLGEHERTGRVALGQFWGRRVRRLAPAAVLCLALVVIASFLLLSASDLVQTRRDIAAAALEVANWHVLLGGQSYAQLFSGHQSPVLHFWSLAIEEQFYFVFPLVMVGLLAIRRRAAVPIGLAVLAALSVASALATSNHDLVYYGTHTRAAELLIGALLACAMRWRLPTLVAARRGSVQSVAFACFAAAGVAVAITDQSAAWLYRGGFPLMALLWCPLIIGAVVAGPFASVVGWRPLAAIGRRSYGIYLFHWPVFILLSSQRLHLSTWPARAVQVLIVAVVTECSYRFVERPIRGRVVLSKPRTMRVVALGSILTLVAVVALAPTATTPPTERSMAEAPDQPVHFAPAPVAGTVATSAPRPGTPVAVTPTDAPTTTVAPTAISLEVIGGDRLLADRIDAAAVLPGVQPSFKIVDAVHPGCALVRPDAEASTLPLCAPVPASIGDGGPTRNVVALMIGPIEHDAYTNLMLGYSVTRTMAEQYQLAQAARQQAVAAFEQLGSLAKTVIIVDAGAADDFLGVALTEATISTPSLHRVTPDQVRSYLAAHVAAHPVAAATDAAAAPMRVMVIGDSTSYGIAVTLSRQPGGRFDVLWAGKRNCPLVVADSIKWMAGTEFSMADCPRADPDWTRSAVQFRPDVILAVDGMPEEVAQRYPGDSVWHVPGDPAYVANHDTAIAGLMQVAASVGAVVLMTDSPGPAAGGPQWAEPLSIAAFNQQVQRWDAQWAPLEAVPYGTLIDSAEKLAGHNLRPDGLHLDDSVLDAVVGNPLAQTLATRVPALQATLTASKCRVPGPYGFVLDLANCH